MYDVCILYALRKTGVFHMRITQNWPDELVSELDEQAASYGITRTSYVVMALKQKVQSEIMLRSMPDMQKLMNEMTLKLSKMTPEQIDGKLHE